MSEHRSPFDQALDLFVYAPLGLALQVQQEFPELVQRGRQAVTTQGAMYRAVGEFAASQVRQKAEQHAGGIYDLLSSVGLIDRDAASEAPSTDHDVTGDEPVDAPPTAAPPAANAEAVATATATAELPIADYDALPAAQILPLLPELSPAEQDEIARYEASGRGRRTILGRLERLAAQRDEG